MKYFSITYPNHTTLIVKCDATIGQVLEELSLGRGLKHMSGAIYNPKAFLTLSEISIPDKRQQTVAQELSKVLIGS